MLIDWTVKVHIWQNKYTKLINTLDFFVFIIFENFVFFSNLMVCQRLGKMPVFVLSLGGTLLVFPSGQDDCILPAHVANHSVQFSSCC